MTHRSFAWILCLAVIALACGPHARNEDGDANASVPSSRAAARPDTQTLVTSAKVAVGARVNFALQVTNLANRAVEVNFPSGQTHEFVVLDTLGREVWRWSQGRMFTQSLQNREVGANQTLSYREQWDPKGRRGHYTALAVLRSNNHPIEKRIDFALP